MYGLDSAKSRHSGDNRANTRACGRDDRVLSVGRQRRSRPGDDVVDSSTQSQDNRRRVGSREHGSDDSAISKRQRYGGERVTVVEDERKEASEKRKRSRSGSRRRDEDRKRRRRSQEVMSSPRGRFREIRTDGRYCGERDKDEKISNALQQRIDRLKEEIEQAKMELVTDKRAFHSRSTSMEKNKSYNRSCRSKSRSLEFEGNSFSNHRGASDSFVHGAESHPQPSMNQFHPPSGDR